MAIASELQDQSKAEGYPVRTNVLQQSHWRALDYLGAVLVELAQVPGKKTGH